MDGFGQTLTQRIEILAARLGKVEVLADARAHLLLGQRIGAMRIQEVMAQFPGLLLQIVNAKRADRLHKIWRHPHQQTHFFLKLTCQTRAEAPPVAAPDDAAVASPAVVAIRQ